MRDRGRRRLRRLGVNIGSVKAKVLLLILVAAAPLAADLFYSRLLLRESAREAIERDALALNREMSRAYQATVYRTRELLRTARSLPAVRHRDSDKCRRTLANLLAEHDHLANIGVIDAASGYLECNALPLEDDVYLGDRAYFQAARDTGRFEVGEFQTGRVARVPMVVFADMMAANGPAPAVIYASVKLSWLNELALRRQWAEGAQLLLLDSAARVLAASPKAAARVGERIAQRQVIAALPRADDAPLFIAAGRDTERLFAVSSLDELGSRTLYLVSSLPTRQAFAAVSAVSAWGIGAAVLSIGLLVVAGGVLGERLVFARVRRLVEVTRAISRGAFDVRTGFAGRDELAQLGQSFDAMAQRLSGQVADLQRLGRARQVLSSINGAILRIRDRDELLAETVRIAVEVGRLAGAGFLIRTAGGRFDLAAHAGEGAALFERLADETNRVDAGAEDRDEVAAMRQGARLIADEVQVIRPCAGTRAAPEGARILALLPVHNRDEYAGMLLLLDDRPESFRGENLELFTEVAADAGLGLQLIAGEQERAQAAFADPVTGLPNRALLVDRMGQLLSRAAFDGRSLGVAVFGIGGIESVSDAFGHSAGDRMLQTVAAALQGALRPGDTLARVSGRTLAVLLADVNDETDVPGVVRRLHEAVPGELELGAHRLRIGVDVGVATYPAGGREAAQLLQRADLARRAPPQPDGEVIRVYTSGDNESARRRLLLDSEMQRALEAERFRLCYQPVVDLAGSQVAGFEALLRWDDPTLGCVSPAEFIPVAEASGLIVPLGDWVLEAVCRQIRCWEDSDVRPGRISINISARQLQQTDLAARWRAICERHGVLPERHPLAVEITETAYMTNMERTGTLLRELRRRGFAVYLDDFGTGYSSLAYMLQLPIDVLKADISFVRDLPENQDSRALMELIVALAHKMDLRVVAEGVESGAHERILRAFGCDMAQGYHYSRPLEAGDVPAFLRRWEAG